jgi:hypothetical protein
VHDVVPCNRASEFIALLRPSDPRWLAPGESRCAWIFRGEGDAAFELTPSAWRQSALTHPLRRQIDAELSKESVLVNYAQQATLTYRASDADLFRAVIGQRLFEYSAVVEFVEGIDRLGLPIPGGMFSLPKWSEDIWDSRQSFFRGATTFHAAFALARHHRMPSRLSDWTANPLIAAFFASEPSEVELSDRIAVWAYRTTAQPRRGRPERICIFRVERSNIGFLHAQEGLFLYISGGNEFYFRTRTWPRFEDLAADEDLVQITLPRSQIQELRRLLAAEGIDRPKLMPTHDNVAICLTEHWESLSSTLAVVSDAGTTDQAAGGNADPGEPSVNANAEPNAD